MARQLSGTFDLSDNLRPGKPELQLRLRDGALALGLDASTIATQLRAAFYGTTASEIQVGPEPTRLTYGWPEMTAPT